MSWWSQCFHLASEGYPLLGGWHCWNYHGVYGYHPAPVWLVIHWTEWCRIKNKAKGEIKDKKLFTRGWPYELKGVMHLPSGSAKKTCKYHLKHHKQ